jgi:hypothetical protein
MRVYNAVDDVASNVHIKCLPVSGTPMTPGNAPQVFVTPNKIEEYRGDKSWWLQYSAAYEKLARLSPTVNSPTV